MPWGGLAIGVGGGLLKSYLDQKTAAKQQQLQAQIARYSPWTGMKANPVTPINTISEVLPFATAGAGAGMQNKLNNSLANRLDAGLNTGSDLPSASDTSSVGAMTGTGASALAANTPSFLPADSALSVGDQSTLDSGGYHGQTSYIPPAMPDQYTTPMETDPNFTDKKMSIMPGPGGKQQGLWDMIMLGKLGGNNNSSTGQ